MVLWAADRAAYGRLARLITVGRRRAEKGQCRLTFDDLAGLAAGLLAGVVADFGDRRPEAEMAKYRELFGDRCYLLAELHRGPDDQRRLARLVELSRRSGAPLAAAGDVHYHVPERQALCDALTAIRCGCTVAAAGGRLFPNAQRHLQSPDAVAAAFARAPEAVRRTRGDRRSLHVLARRVALRVSGGVGPAGPHAQRASRPADVGGGGGSAIRRAFPSGCGGCWSTSCG